jgi:hypothetical protein
VRIRIDIDCHLCGSDAIRAMLRSSSAQRFSSPNLQFPLICEVVLSAVVALARPLKHNPARLPLLRDQDARPPTVVRERVESDFGTLVARHGD